LRRHLRDPPGPRRDPLGNLNTEILTVPVRGREGRVVREPVGDTTVGAETKGPPRPKAPEHSAGAASADGQNAGGPARCRAGPRTL
jgi:hypothetical protein